MSSENKPKKEKVIIVGFAPSYAEVPWQEDVENTEIFCLNEFYKVAKNIPGFRCDRWFEIHDLNSPSKSTPEHIAFLRQCPVPLYLQKKRDDIPNGIVFPFYEIIEWMESKGFKGSRYFTNSVAYLTMYAAYLGFKKLEIYGVDMSTESEYSHQKASEEYMIGLCEGMGIEVYIPQSSELLKCNQLYALESSNKLRVWVKTQVGELKKRTQHFAQQQAQAQQAAHQAEIAQAEVRGAISAYGEWLKRSQ